MQNADGDYPITKVQPTVATMGFAVRVRTEGQKYGPTCHQRDRTDVTVFVTLVRLSSLGQHVGVLALAGYKRRESALTAGPISNKFYAYKHRDGSRAVCSPGGGGEMAYE